MKVKYRSGTIQNPWLATPSRITTAAITPHGLTTSPKVSFAGYIGIVPVTKIMMNKEGALLKQKFVEKDFPQPLIELAFNMYLTSTDQASREESQQPRFITEFHSKCNNMLPKSKFAYRRARKFYWLPVN